MTLSESPTEFHGLASLRVAAPLQRPQRPEAATGAAGAVAGGPQAARAFEARATRAPDGLYAHGGKRAANLALLVLVLPFALALGIPIAVANALLFLDPRRVFFHQERVGRHGRTFRIWKFRTMREAAPDHHFHSWKNGDDGLRVTPFGRLLRNSHLDELPQLINVLLGEMDFVGPRPEMVQIHEWACAEIPGFERRNVVRPGITGLAQVTQGYAGMCSKAYAAKLGSDLDYIASITLRRDVGILMRTLTWMLEGRGWRAESGDGARSTGRESVAPLAAGAVHEDTMSPCPAPASSHTLRSSSTTRAPRTRSGPTV